MPQITVSPQSGSGNITTDGTIELQFGNQTFASLNGGTGVGLSVFAGNARAVFRASATTNQFDFFGRYGATFPTSVGMTGIFTAGQLKLYGNTTKQNSLAGNFDIHLCGFTPRSYSTFVNTDFGTRGSVSFGSVAFVDWNASGWNTITINSAGLNYLNGFNAGIAPLMCRFGDDMNNAFTGAWVSGATSEIKWQGAENANPPQLILDYSLIDGNRDNYTPRHKGGKWQYYGRC